MCSIYEMDYDYKYRKYKTKYQNVKNQKSKWRLVGGINDVVPYHQPCDDYETILNKWKQMNIDIGDLKSFKIIRDRGFEYGRSYVNEYEGTEEPMELSVKALMEMVTSNIVPKEAVKQATILATKQMCEKFNGNASIEEEMTKYKINKIHYDCQNCDTWNKFFRRSLHKGFNYCSDKPDDRIFRSPATSYVVVYPTIGDATKLWIKGGTREFVIKRQKFTVEQMLGGISDMGDGRDDYMVIINRLAPAHYHRFHVPLSGTIIRLCYIPGMLYSVNPIIVNSGVNVFGENKRVVLEIETNEFGMIYMVIVGATIVGSIVLTEHLDDTEGGSLRALNKYLATLNGCDVVDPVEKGVIDLRARGEEVKVVQGQNLGYFQYGGSTIVTLVRDQGMMINPIIGSLSNPKSGLTEDVKEFEVLLMDPLILKN